MCKMKFARIMYGRERERERERVPVTLHRMCAFVIYHANELSCKPPPKWKTKKLSKENLWRRSNHLLFFRFPPPKCFSFSFLLPFFFFSLSFGTSSSPSSFRQQLKDRVTSSSNSSSFQNILSNFCNYSGKGRQKFRRGFLLPLQTCCKLNSQRRTSSNKHVLCWRREGRSGGEGGWKMISFLYIFIPGFCALLLYTRSGAKSGKR